MRVRSLTVAALTVAALEIIPMPDDPLAYFLTIHTYGSRLHGNEFGSVDWAHNVYGEPFAASNPQREAAMRRRMRDEPVTFGAAERRCVQNSCLETCRYRGWRVHALHVRATHLHIVVSALVKPEKVLNDLKAYATRHLRQQILIRPGAAVWSRHGSTRYLWHDHAVMGAVSYTLNDQGPVLDPLPFVSEEFRGALRPPGSKTSEPRP